MTLNPLRRLLALAEEEQRQELSADFEQWLFLEEDIELPSDDAEVLRTRRDLHLRNFVLQARAVELLYAHAPQLEQLVIDEVGFAEGALAQLVAPPPAHPLCRLGVYRSEEGNVDWRLLARSPLGERLTSLSAQTSDAGCAELLALPALSTLSVEADLGPLTAAVLRAGTVMTGLRALELRSLAPRASPEWLAALGDWSLPALELLDLEATLESGWAELLTRAPMFAAVTVLGFGRTKIGAEGVEALASRALPRLRSLTLSGVTDRGVRALTEASWGATLSTLTVVRSGASEAAWANFRAVRPGIALHLL